MMIINLFNFFLWFVGNSFFGLQDWYFKSHNYDPLAWSCYGEINNFGSFNSNLNTSHIGSYFSLKEKESLIIIGDVPAKYYSIQIYDSLRKNIGNLNNNMIKTIDGKFIINITKNKALVSENNTIYLSTNDIFLLLILRVYNFQNQFKFNKYSNLPNIFKFNQSGHIIEIANAPHYSKIKFDISANSYTNVWTSKYENMPNNFFRLEPNEYLPDENSHYLISVINTNIKSYIRNDYTFVNTKSYTCWNNNTQNITQNITNQSYCRHGFRTTHNITYNVTEIKCNFTTIKKTIGAIITGHLPMVKYDYLKNNSSYYDVNHISFNFGSYDQPSAKFYKFDEKTKRGIRDIDIITRYKNNHNWNLLNRPYIIYIGQNISHIKQLGGNPNVDLYMIYPTDVFSNQPIHNPVIIFRNFMPQNHFAYGINRIRKSYSSPTECENVMKKYYPKIDFVIN